MTGIISWAHAVSELVLRFWKMIKFQRSCHEKIKWKNELLLGLEGQKGGGRWEIHHDASFCICITYLSLTAVFILELILKLHFWTIDFQTYQMKKENKYSSCKDLLGRLIDLLSFKWCWGLVSRHEAMLWTDDWAKTIFKCLAISFCPCDMRTRLHLRNMSKTLPTKHASVDLF